MLNSFATITFNSVTSITKSKVKSFLMKPAVHILFQVFAKHATAFTTTNLFLFFITVIVHGFATDGASQVGSMMMGLPFLLLALPAVVILLMQNSYEMKKSALQTEKA